MALKKIALLLLVPVVAFASYGISGCVHGEHDNTPLTITTTSLPPGMSGSAYSYTLEAVGGKIPYTWSIEAGGATLPPGIYMSESGNLSGAPTTDGSYSFTVVVTDSDKDMRVASKNFTIDVYPREDVTITSSTIPGYVNEAVDHQLTAVGGEAPYVWEIVSGGYLGSTYRLTTDLYLSISGGISGTPTDVGVHHIIIRAEDQLANSDERDIVITIGEREAELSIDMSSQLPDRSVTNYPVELKAVGGWLPYTWSVESGSAPLSDAGLTDPYWNATDSRWEINVSGSTTGLPEYSFSLQVTDSATPTPTTVTKIFKITVK